MPKSETGLEGFPDADAVRAALERMLGTDAFRASPQLAAFLRYVVEAKLRGEADRIKGYTIAVEALGRADDFDPQVDPIVRVEAMRLRRAVNRYYANAGNHEAVVIELPLGSYVPVFRRNVISVLPAPIPLPVPEPALLRARFTPPRVRLRHAAAAVALVLFGAGLYGGLDLWFDFNTPNPQPVASALSAQTRSAPDNPRAGPGYPVVFVGAFQTSGNSARAQSADKLRAKLRDALARFDEIYVRAEAPRQGEFYQLTASIEYDAAGMVSLNVRLTDTRDESLAYSQTFSRDARDGRDGNSVQDEDLIVREISAALAQPYGIIHARERASQINAGTGNPHYRCLLDSYEFWRSYDPAVHAHARDCLEKATKADPAFAVGFASLAELVLHEYRRGLNLRPGDAPPLDRALRAARHAVELKPGSAKAHQALMDVLFLRGEYELALGAGQKAVLLNPYNPNILACYGARLIALGQLDKGTRYLKQVAEFTVVRPAWIDFFLFLAAYLGDDRNAAATHAAQIMSEQSSLGFLAQALVAAQQGNLAAARQLLDRLVAIQPGWGEDPRRELKKMFPADAVVNRLARGLAQAGLSASN